MRWLAGVVAAVILLLLIYFGSAASSLAKLAAAVRAGDGAAVLARTDLKTLNHSLTDQIVRSYLERIGATRQIKPMERVLINTYGASIADAMVAKMLTPERLTQMLKTGSLDAPGVPSFAGLPALADLQTSDWLSLLGRVKVIKPVLLAIRVSNSSEPDDYAAIDLHSEGLDWKLAGIELPKPIVRDLAASLPVK
ncbi:Protein of unknown function [Bradyrhizobium lablabi]|uniref:DUF2939 domain-containing protein n=1 Tax=Bradyrhizobium lablabi TaxID=722472 RepID=A0A1M7B9W9_9BRAD|nr:DUF2939 domain-containing protein [Bradyrhizobium lablabi]SHL51439.1 Protein of unknown function [Bradyrhizobium lablabi]